VICHAIRHASQQNAFNASDADGRYTYVWTPSTSGTYHVRASVDSDAIYSASVSSSYLITVEKITPSLTCDISSSDILLDESITISGNVNPTDVDAPVDIQCTHDGQATTLATVTPNTDGQFVYQWTPSQTGTYQIKAISSSDDRYNEVASAPVTLFVNTQPVSQWMFLAPIGLLALVAIFFIQRSRTK
jgi:hypothetical protein